MKEKTFKRENSLLGSSSDNESFLEDYDEAAKEKKLIIALCAVGIIFSIIVGNATFRYVSSNVIGSGKEEDRPLPESTEKEEKEVDPRVNKFAYEAKGELWYFDIEKNKKEEIETTKGWTLGAKSWKGQEELTYSECLENTCKINTVNISKDEIVDSFEIQGDDILALKWSNTGNNFAYLFSQGDSAYLTLKNGQAYRSLGKYKYDSQKPLDFDDATYIRFSPNDERILLVNTYTYVSEPTVLVLDLNGSVLLSLTKEWGNVPSSAFFTSNDLLYYKKDNGIYVRTIGEKKERQLTDRIVGAFDFKPSPDKSKIAYWTYDWPGGVMTIWIYEIGSGDLSRLRDQQSRPLWIDNETLVSFQTPDCIQCPMSEIEYTGISKVDLDTLVVGQILKSKNIAGVVSEEF